MYLANIFLQTVATHFVKPLQFITLFNWVWIQIELKHESFYSFSAFCTFFFLLRFICNNKRTPPEDKQTEFWISIKVSIALAQHLNGKKEQQISKKSEKNNDEKAAEHTRTMEKELKKAVTHRSLSVCAIFLYSLYFSIAVGFQCDDDSCFFMVHGKYVILVRMRVCVCVCWWCVSLVVFFVCDRETASANIYRNFICCLCVLL